jgi:hypothetical protein
MDEQPYTIEELSDDETHYIPVDEDGHRPSEAGGCFCSPHIRIGAVGISVIHHPFVSA